MGLLRVSSRRLLAASETPETMTAREQSIMCGAEKLFYVNISHDDVETRIAVSV